MCIRDRCTSYIARAQDHILLLKKGDKTIQQLYKGSDIAVLLPGKSWLQGKLRDIRNDTIVISPEIVHYSHFGNDTIHTVSRTFALSEILGVPKKGVKIIYEDGRYQVSRSGSKENWRAFRNGNYLIVGSAGYLLLNLVNGPARGWGNQRLIATGVLAGGVILKLIYKHYHLLGKRYRLEII